MAKPKANPGAAPPSPTPSTRRPLNTLFLLLFLATSAVFTWLMRVDTVRNDVPTGFQSVMETSALDNGVPLVASYTGVRAVDEISKLLVAAFIAGTAGWDAGVHEQQAYFLMNWFPVVCVCCVEGARTRNAGRVVSYVALLSAFYQTLGAGIVLPLYYAAYGREVPIASARVLLPAAVLGYLAPTAALWYVPWGDVTTVQHLTLFWQPSPIYVSALVSLFSFFAPSATAKNGDVKHLKRVYLAAGIVSTASHFLMLYNCLTSDNPQLSLSYVFLPNRAAWKDSMTMGLHYIFQWDFFGAFGSLLFWCWLVVYDVLRILGQSGPLPLIKTVFGIAFVTLVASPGTAIAMVCSWREDRLVMIESGIRGTLKKPKAA
ncbi:hypothetical protein F4804DRAFT_351748 [Jackrogersella minutella]|nr:hypothetical protein F4804DRAFT_351748 [Jackrogersella minutella]